MIKRIDKSFITEFYIVMQASWISAEQLATLSNHSADAFISPLPAFQVTRVHGADQRHYLQGQTTCDFLSLHADSVLRGAHCDAKGKMWASFHAIVADDETWLVGFRDEMQASLTQLKKFGVFSKVTFSDNPQAIAVFGIAGDNVAPLLQQLGFDDQGAQHQQSDTLPAMGALQAKAHLLRLAAHHYMLLLDAADASAFLHAYQGKLAAPPQWLQQHIKLGLPYIEQAIIGEYVPQQLNMQALDAISFTKGCYIGQETVARMKYLGKNKRAMYLLQANTNSTPSAGAGIDMQLDTHWRRAGQVINAVNIHDALWLLAVLPNDTTEQTALRLSDEPDTHCQIHPLPYSLN